jgi:hypothetical protein
MDDANIQMKVSGHHDLLKNNITMVTDNDNNDNYNNNVSNVNGDEGASEYTYGQGAAIQNSDGSDYVRVTLQQTVIYGPNSVLSSITMPALPKRLLVTHPNPFSIPTLLRFPCVPMQYAFRL